MKAAIRERPFDFQGGGGGGLVRLEYFFYMFSETEIFFQHHRGLEFFFLPMYDARSIKSVICLEKTTIHNLQIYNKEQFFPQFIFHLGHTPRTYTQ